MKRGVALPSSGRRRGSVALASTVLVATVLTASPIVATAAESNVVGDFNGDGYADLVIGVAGEDIGSLADAGAVNIIYGDSSGLNLNHSQSLSQKGAIAGAAEAGDQFGRSFAAGDFNNDGRSDLVVGAPNEAIGSVQAAGGMTAIYGSSSGLRTSGTKSFDQSGPINGKPETGDRFGSAIAAGDLNGDGHDDVVVGAPGEDEGSKVDSGIIHVIFGSSSGLTSAGDKSFGQAGPIPGAAENDDRFGSALALGDFDGDGHLDIAVGSPGEDIGSKLDAGAVTIIYGSSSGPSASNFDSFSQSGAIIGSPETGDLFGATVATGDFDGDGYDDLAVGAPGEAVGSRSQAGVVHVIFGSANGLTTSGNEYLKQSDVSSGANEAGDRFGASLAAGNFNGDNRDDLAIGVPGEDLGSIVDAGVTNIVYGSSSGLKNGSNWSFSQSGSIAGAVEAHDLLGSSMYVADLNGDGYDDVAAGAPGEDVGGAIDAGIANVVYGSASGLRKSGNESVGQAGPVAGGAETGDGFGLPQHDSWLDRVNLYRQQAGLDPVTQRNSVSSGALAHSRYMVLNGAVTHSENSSNPGYTQAGQAAGSRSNVYGTTWAATSDIASVDGWVTGPFHAVGFLTPSLSEVGFGAYRDPDASYLRMAATLDIYTADRDWSNQADNAYTWPGDGTVVPVRRHVSEYPSPTSECPSHSGLPVLAFFENSVSVSASSFTHNGSDIAFCTFDGTNYSNPDSGAQTVGRQILSSANAVVLMPKSALTAGEEYCFSATSGSESVNTCFKVDPNA